MKKRIKNIISKVVVLIIILSTNCLVYSQEMSNEQYKKIIDEVNALLANDKNNAFYYSVRANAYYNLNEIDQALEDLNKAISLDEKNWENYYNKGIIKNKQDKNQEALSCFTTAISLDANNAELFFARADLYYKIESYDLAIKDNTKALDINPDLAEAYNNRGLAYSKINMYDEAINDFTTALTKVVNEKYYYNRGYVRLLQGKVDLAYQDLSKALEINSESIYSNYYMALVLKKMNDLDKAKSYFEKAKKNGLPENYKLEF